MPTSLVSRRLGRPVSVHLRALGDDGVLAISMAVVAAIGRSFSRWRPMIGCFHAALGQVFGMLFRQCRGRHRHPPIPLLPASNVQRGLWRSRSGGLRGRHSFVMGQCIQGIATVNGPAQRLIECLVGCCQQAPASRLIPRPGEFFGFRGLSPEFPSREFHCSATCVLCHCSSPVLLSSCALVATCARSFLTSRFQCLVIVIPLVAVLWPLAVPCQGRFLWIIADGCKSSQTAVVLLSSVRLQVDHVSLLHAHESLLVGFLRECLPRGHAFTGHSLVNLGIGAHLRQQTSSHNAEQCASLGNHRTPNGPKFALGRCAFWTTRASLFKQAQVVGRNVRPVWLPMFVTCTAR